MQLLFPISTVFTRACLADSRSLKSCLTDEEAHQLHKKAKEEEYSDSFWLYGFKFKELG